MQSTEVEQPQKLCNLSTTDEQKDSADIFLGDTRCPNLGRVWLS